ncbi:hypothetical protein LTR08_000945 [Meristemomyces frigidus]|nr:hypothetical protein LTR08_000945 [Meristemomyces frigidus]
MENSPFGGLSAELRNKIWELVLVDDKEFEIHRGKYAYSSSDHVLEQRHLLALTATCKQIHHESTPMFYSLNAFRFPSNLFAYPCGSYLSEFCTRIGPTNTLALMLVAIEYHTFRIYWTHKVDRNEMKKLFQEVSIGDVCALDCPIRVNISLWENCRIQHRLSFELHNRRSFEADWEASEQQFGTKLFHEKFEE